MKLDVEIGGRKRQLDISRAGSRVRCVIDGRAVEVDAAEISDGEYSFVIGERSVEARVEPRGAVLRVTSRGHEFTARVIDPRKCRRGAGALAAEGRQQVVAPMPGKIIRVLVNTGDAVEAGQGLLVVEAMKMQNEIRSPKAGVVEKLLVTEGHAVNAGDALAVVV